MLERSQNLVNQLIEKTKQGKIAWTTAFEDGQFKTVLPEGNLAFVVQVKPDVRRFLMLDENQEYVLSQEMNEIEAAAWGVQAPEHQLYESIGTLQELARSQALQVNEKLTKAERFLAAI